MVVRLDDAEATEAFGARLAAQLRPGDVIALFGALGAGKTTLARGILRGLGHEGDVASPTFPIVQVYEPPQVRIPLWHVDLYRIEHVEELDELGIEDARGEAALVVEWPERLPRIWPEALRLRLNDANGGGRTLEVDAPEVWRDRIVTP
jgi:tRNA threonylcarbamoyladenosine biosynthesis protein TsaE